MKHSYPGNRFLVELYKAQWLWMWREGQTMSSEVFATAAGVLDCSFKLHTTSVVDSHIHWKLSTMYHLFSS